MSGQTIEQEVLLGPEPEAAQTLLIGDDLGDFHRRELDIEVLDLFGEHLAQESARLVSIRSEPNRHLDERHSLVELVRLPEQVGLFQQTVDAARVARFGSLPSPLPDLYRAQLLQSRERAQHRGDRRPEL